MTHPWLAPSLTPEQRAAAFWPEAGMRGDVGDLAEAFASHARAAVAASEQRLSALEQALTASHHWLLVLVEQLGLDPDETRYDFSAVNRTTGERRPMGAATLAAQLATNRKLLNSLPPA